jgi:hypothetical protein
LVRHEEPSSSDRLCSLLRSFLLFRPAKALRGSDPFAGVSAHVALDGLPAWPDVTGQEGADLLESGDFGINGGEKLGSIHASTISLSWAPEALGALAVVVQVGSCFV